jgi:C1A family cysteine protease
LNLPDRCNIKITSPDTYDWTDPGMNACGINVVTDVVNQNLCGSCYAFATIAAVESSISIATGTLSNSLSAQQIMDCTYNIPLPLSNIKNTGCFGGYISISMLYAANSEYGLCTSTAYPYNGYTGQCTEQKCAGGAKIVGFNNVKNIDKIKLQNYIRNNGPVVASISTSFSMLFYRNLNSINIYTGGCGLPSITAHSVLVVGFGVLNGRSYWKIKNSWGTSWGHGGYLYLDADTINGKCGIFTDIFYVQ